MSLWKTLFDFVDKERTRFDNVRHDTHALQFEIESNIHFIVDGLALKLSAADIINGLETKAFEHAMSSGLRIRQATLSTKIIEGYKEFDKYLGEPSDVLVKKLYMKITVLRKLINAGKLDQDLKLKSLFRLLMLVHFHLAAKPLPKAKVKAKN
ncbi:hypothetical protein [Shewanella livingstonensis]|uniref:Uncharacterized protein n=1 Tax=Shewanella livingstonensis TaxID=150120 RepID=A0A3G8LY75_9GAMM|nr:hypothetical protein [Shewanella livingstonensis]AZG74377.1 hypothetical protein EGC82_17435 [Shewanella livingstonensis]